MKSMKLVKAVDLTEDWSWQDKVLKLLSVDLDDQ